MTSCYVGFGKDARYAKAGDNGSFWLVLSKYVFKGKEDVEF